MNSLAVRNKKKKSTSKYFALDTTAHEDAWRENLSG